MQMLRFDCRGLLVFMCLALAGVARPALAAPEFNPFTQRAQAALETDRLIVRLRADPGTGLPAQSVAGPAAIAPAAVAAGSARVASLARRAGLAMHRSHAITEHLHVMHLATTLSGTGLEAALARVRSDAEVESAEPDGRKYPHATLPGDPLFAGVPGQGGQWYLMAPTATTCNNVSCGTTTAAVDAVTAWDTSRGSAGVVIAVLDTGVRFDHPDLMRASAAGRLLPGYDFVGTDGGGTASNSYLTANDGDGWDADPSDPGDWIDATDKAKPLFSTCTQDASSWHGTRVSGIVGALTNNSQGVAGLDWNAWLLPVRVLGKCGGYDSDIVAAIRWASGFAVAGVPANPYPARIINLSLGGTTSCSGEYQVAIDAAIARGVLLVASAGNEGGPVDAPANCGGVVAVTGARHVGTKVGYGNVSGSIVDTATSLSMFAAVTLAAPGGNCVNTSGGACLFSIDTSTNLGSKQPGANGYTDRFNYNVGTSFSSPIVAGIAGLMLAVNGNLRPAQLLARLQEGATPFPSIPVDSAGAPIPQCRVATGVNDTAQSIECNCTTATCGAGLANAPRAVAAALRPIAAVQVAASTMPGQPVSLDAGGSAAACSRSVASYAWSVVPGSYSGAAPVFSSATNLARASIPAPASGTFTVRVTVTDDQGRSDTADVVVGATRVSTGAPGVAGTSACLAAITPARTTTPQASGGGGGGGGGALDTATLLAAGLCAAALALTRRRRRAALTP